MPFPIIATLLAFIGLCWITDLQGRRIPNVLSGSAMLAGIILNVLYFHSAGLVASIGGLALAGAVLLFPFALGGVGGGDVKMMGAVGALLGPRLALSGMAMGMVLGGVVMAVHLVRQGRLREKLVATGTMFRAAGSTRSLSPLKVSAADQDAVALPYSVPLGLGTIVALGLVGCVGAS